MSLHEAQIKVSLKIEEARDGLEKAMFIFCEKWAKTEEQKNEMWKELQNFMNTAAQYGAVSEYLESTLKKTDG
jgi:hypothetical protein